MRPGVWVAAFMQRLRELGWAEGRTVAIEYRWARDARRFAELRGRVRHAQGRRHPYGGKPVVIAAQQATSAIPIVFPIAIDPVDTGLIASLARPGGNVTGLSNQTADLAGKRLELLREILPGLHRLAIIGNVGYPAVPLEYSKSRQRPGRLAWKSLHPESGDSDIAPAIEALRSNAQAVLYVSGDALVTANRTRIAS